MQHSYFMLEKGDERIDTDTMINALMGLESEVGVTSELEEAARWAQEDKSGQEIRIIEFRVNRLSRPVAKRTKPALVWAKRAGGNGKTVK